MRDMKIADRQATPSEHSERLEEDNEMDEDGLVRAGDYFKIKRKSNAE